MKNKFSRIISSVLILAFLISCFTVFVFASDAEALDASEDGITLLINRTYDEGWNYANGFNSNIQKHEYTVEYEETHNYDYNYYCRITDNDSTAGYIELEYGENAISYGNSIVEMDIKTDDINNMGTIFSLRGTISNKAKDFNLMSISNNTINLVSAGEIVNANVPGYLLGKADHEWIHVAFVFTLNQRRCPVCNSVSTIAPGQNEAERICCYDAETGEGGGVIISQMGKVLGVRIYFGAAECFDVDSAIEASTLSAEAKNLYATYYYDTSLEGINVANSFRLGIPGSAKEGQSYCVDNLSFYNGSDRPIDVSKYGHGANVNESAAKTEEIFSSSSEKTALQYLNEGLVMKVGVDYCLSKNVKTNIMTDAETGLAYGAPVKIDGTVYVPLQAFLDWIGYPMFAHEDNKSFDISTANGSTFVTIGRDTATANGSIIQLSKAPSLVTDAQTEEQYIVVALDDIGNLFEGYYVTYDDMGLIVISQGKDLFNRESDLSLMLDVMKSFIFDEKTSNEFYSEVKTNTNDFAHPYLVATQAEFDSLNEAYNASVSETPLKGYLTTLVAEAQEIYNYYTSVDVEVTDEVTGKVTIVRTPAGPTGDYGKLAAEIVNPHKLVETAKLNNGYSYVGGRLAEIVEYTNDLRTLAFAYQVTRNKNYAILAYDVAVSLAKWDHWGPDYFIHCAEATSNYALAYDWLYNEWRTLGYDLGVLEDAIFVKGINQGYLSSIGSDIDTKLFRNQASEFQYSTLTNNWNVVGTSGMVIASLAILGSDYLTAAEERGNEKYSRYVEQAGWLLENNIKSLIDIGLDAYAPDGEYVASPTFWSNSTNALSLMVWSLDTAVGTDLGLMNTWGMDKTFYFAYQTEYKVNASEKNPVGYEMWNYHESYGNAYQDTSFYFFAAEALGEQTLAALRLNQLESKPVSMWDALAFKSEYLTADENSEYLTLDYFYDALEGVTSRSDWADGSIYVGIMGNKNDAVGGQIDSGNFIYANKGITWICDMGGDDPLLYGYNLEDHRYGYYRMSGEGANTVIVTSESGTMPYGQVLNAGGTMITSYTEDAGMYTIIDNTAVYGSTVNLAQRGLLFTNNRETVVIHDEIAFQGVRSGSWVAHTPIPTQNIYISSDGRTAHLWENGEWLRLSIVAEVADLKFTLMDCSDASMLLSDTHKSNYSTLMKHNAEISKTGYSKLVISFKNVLAFECAIVIDSVKDDTNTSEVRYEYKRLSDWNENLVTEEFHATVKDENAISNSDISDIKKYTDNATIHYNNGYAFTTRIKDFYRDLVNVAAAARWFVPTGVINSVNEAYSAYYDYYLTYVNLYKQFKDDLNYYTVEGADIALYLCGYN